MTVEEVVAWRDLKMLASKVYRQFHALPGCYLEAEDVHSVGAAAIASKLAANPECEPPLLKTIAYRRMVDYGRKCSDVRRHDHLAEGCRGLRAFVVFENIEHNLRAGRSPLQEAIGAEVRNWLRTGNFGLNSKEVEALKLYYWIGATESEIMAALNKGERTSAYYWIRRAEAKIRRGLETLAAGFR